MEQQENKLAQIIKSIKKVDKSMYNKIDDNFSKFAMPLGSLGEMQRFVEHICGIFNDEKPTIDKKALVVFCADNEYN